jgi:hypothetical protein
MSIRLKATLYPILRRSSAWRRRLTLEKNGNAWTRLRSPHCDTVVAALIGAVASALGSILAFVVGIRRSLRTSNGAPLAKVLEARLGHLQDGQDRLERRLERMEGSLAEVREFLAYERGRTASPRRTPRPPG